jgi:4a-hydroxytetrahydrobiopterin dehydratase
MDLKKLNESEIQNNLETLNSNLENVWVLENDKLTKTYKFKDFVEAFGFMSRTASHAEEVNHHPEWFNVYNTVKVQLATHDVSGISYKDFDLKKRWTN